MVPISPHLTLFETGLRPEREELELGESKDAREQDQPPRNQRGEARQPALANDRPTSDLDPESGE